jgi:hypothetical protein
MKKESKVSFLVAIVGMVLFTGLLIMGYISPAVYALLIPLLAATCFGIYGFNRLREIDFKNLKIILAEMKTVKEDIYATEKDLQKTVFLTVELIAILHAFTSLWGDDDSDKYRDIVLRKKADQLFKHLKVTSNLSKNIFKYKDVINEMQNSEGEERILKWKTFIEILKEDSTL